jgi:hypothetical protein
LENFQILSMDFLKRVGIRQSPMCTEMRLKLRRGFWQFLVSVEREREREGGERERERGREDNHRERCSLRLA